MFAKGKYPKRPREGEFLALCRKDFNDFKEKNGYVLMKYLSTLVKEEKKKGMKSDILRQHKESLEKVNELITKGKTEDAFLTFHRTFPYCMPYREYKAF